MSSTEDRSSRISDSPPSSMTNESCHSRDAASSNGETTDQTNQVTSAANITTHDPQEGPQTHDEGLSAADDGRASTAEEFDSEIMTQNEGITYTKYPISKFQVFTTCTARPSSAKIARRRRKIQLSGIGCG